MNSPTVAAENHRRKEYDLGQHTENGLMVSGEQLAAWLRELIQIPSVSPDQAGPRAGDAGEGRIAARIAQWFSQFGGEVFQEDVWPGRPNVYGIWRSDQSPWLAIDVHTDTVGVEMMPGDPFDGRVEDGKVFGRGAADTKASLAVALALLSEIKSNNRRIPCNLLIAATADEEVTARGAPTFAKWLRDREMVIDELIVAEPTMCAPVHGHKGVLRLTFVIQGKSAHSSQAHLGRNAAVAGAKLALAMEAENGRIQKSAFDPALGPPVLTVTGISGGLGENIVPDRCEVTIDRRIINGEKASSVREALLALASETISLPFRMEVRHAIDAFYRPANTPFAIKTAAWSGKAATTMPFCTNAWAYADVARECVVLGPGSIDQAHTDTEWIAISELERLAQLYSRWWGITT